MDPLLTSSVSGRLYLAAERRLGQFWHASAMGRSTARVWAVLRAVLGGSLLFSLEGTRSRTLSEPMDSLLGKAVAALYGGTLVHLGGSALGRFARGIGAGGSRSLLGAGGSVRLAGSFVAAFAIAKAATSGADTPSSVWPLEIVALAVTAVAGLLVVVVGPRAVPFLGSRPSPSDAPGAPAPAPSDAPPGDAELSDSVNPGAASPAAATADAEVPDARPRLGVGSMSLWALALLAMAAIGVLVGAAAWPAGWFPFFAVVAVVLAGAVFYRSEALLLVMAAFPWVDWIARRALGGGGLSAVWDEAFLLGSFLALFFALVFTRRSELVVTPILAPLALAVVAAVGSVVLMGVPSEVAVFALRVTFQPLLFFFLAQMLPRDRRWVKAAVAVFLAASVLLALHGLFQYATHAPMPARWVDASETKITTRAYSIVENPNGLGALLLLGALLSVSVAMAQVQIYARLAAAAAAVVLVAGLAVTFSRGAWLGFVFGVVCYAVLTNRRLLAAIFAAAAASPFVVPSVLLDRLTFALSPDYLVKSAAAGRLYIWRVALQRIAENPWFGVGLGTFGGTSSYLYGYTSLWVDQYYLQLAAEGGIILFLAFLWLLVRLTKGMVAAHRDQPDPFLRAVVAGALGGCAAVAFANLTASVWETLAVGAGFWFLAGLSTGIGRDRNQALPALSDLGTSGDRA